MAFTSSSKENLDDNSIRKRYVDWVVIIDEDNAIIDENQSNSSNDDIESYKKESNSIDINRRSHSPVYNFNRNNYEESLCDFLKNINLDKVLECLLVPISNIINFLQENIEVNENSDDLQLV